MKKLTWIFMVVATAAVLQPETSSGIVRLDIVSLPAPPGQVVVDIVISGLGSGVPPSVGTFDLDVSFDPSILSPTNVTFGPFLGDPDLAEALTNSNFLPGVVDFAELSLLSPSELDVLQPGAFSLATLAFDTLGPGSSPFVFTQIIVDDAFGNKLPIPEPATGLLLAAGLGAMTVYRTMRR